MTTTSRNSVRNGRLVRDHLVDALGHLELASDVRLPVSRWKRVDRGGRRGPGTGRPPASARCRSARRGRWPRPSARPAPERPGVPAPERQVRASAAGRPPGGGEAVVEAVVDVAELQELHVGELDDLQRLVAVVVEEDRGRPVGDEEVVRAVADVRAGGPRRLPRLRAAPPRGGPGRRARLGRRARDIGGATLEDEVLLAQVVRPERRRGWPAELA